VMDWQILKGQFYQIDSYTPIYSTTPCGVLRRIITDLEVPNISGLFVLKS